MDPLSVTAGTLAIIGAIDASVKCLRKISCIRKAPAELSDLHSEASDLHQVLLLIAAVYDEEAGKNEGSGQESPVQGYSAGTAELEQLVQATLGRYAERAALALDDLNRIVCDYSTSLQSGKKLAGGLAALYWVQSGRKKAIKLRQQLHEIRLNIVATLGAKTSVGISRVEQILHANPTFDLGVSQTITNINISANGTTDRCVPAADESILPKQRQPSRSDSLPPSYANLLSEADTMTKKLLHDTSSQAVSPPTSSARAPAGTIAAAVATAMHNSCVAWCSCSCHVRGHVRSPTMFDPIFGNVSAVYGGVLSAARPCNEYSCRRRSAKALRLNYRPPSWLYSHLFQLSMISTPLYGLKLDLQFPRTIDWDSPVWSYAMNGDVNAIQDLFSRGEASPRDVNPIGGSMLHYATDHKKFELCKLLLNEGANIEHEDDCRRHPAVMAWDHVLSKKLSPEEEYTVGTLFKDSDYIATQGFSQLHKTVLGLLPKDLGTELSYSTAEINAQDGNGRTPLAWAARRGDVGSVQLLLSYGADLSIADNQGLTPIHEAIDVPCARALLIKGANVMSRNAWGRTPLHQICDRGGDVMLMDLLVSYGADVNAADDGGEVALDIAIVHEHIHHDHNGHAAYLLRAGADTTQPTTGGDSPLRFAIMFNTHEILRDILKHPFAFQETKHMFGHTFAHSIARTADAETLDILQTVVSQINFDLTRPDNSGKTAMDYARERFEDREMVVAFEKFAKSAALQTSVTKTMATESLVEIGEEDEYEDNAVFHDSVQYAGTELAV